MLKNDNESSDILINVLELEASAGIATWKVVDFELFRAVNDLKCVGFSE